MITVSFGTFAVETAVTILAPLRAMAFVLVLAPDHDPVMFCRKTNGIFRWQQSSMNACP